jgi:hypothetical protein
LKLVEFSVPVLGLKKNFVDDTTAVAHVPEVLVWDIAGKNAFELVVVSLANVAPPEIVAQVLSPRKNVVVSAVPEASAAVGTAAVVVPDTLAALPLIDALLVM